MNLNLLHDYLDKFLNLDYILNEKQTLKLNLLNYITFHPSPRQNLINTSTCEKYTATTDWNWKLLLAASFWGRSFTWETTPTWFLEEETVRTCRLAHVKRRLSFTTIKWKSLSLENSFGIVGRRSCMQCWYVVLPECNLGTLRGARFWGFNSN